MRDLIVFAVVLLSLPWIFRRPYIGLLVFSWLAYMRPQDLCWGFARTMRFSFIVALTMILGWYTNESQKRPFWTPDIRNRLMLLLALLISLSLLFADQFSELTGRYYFEFLKIILISVFTISQVDSKERLRGIFWVIAISLGFYSVKNGLIGLAKGGTVIQRGPGGMLEDNNDFALALVMNIPLLFYMGQLEGKAWIRRSCLAAIFLTVVTVLLTHSRGGFLAMTGTLMYLAWRSGKLFRATLVLIAVGIGFVNFAPEHVKERILTIFTQGTKEASAASRITSWKLAFRMIKANPVWGVGLRNFQLYWYDPETGWMPPDPKGMQELEGSDESDEEDQGAQQKRHEEGRQLGTGQKAIEVPEGVSHVAHNSYLQIWAEGGSLAFMCYMALLLSLFWSGLSLRKLAKRHNMQWALSYTRMLEASMFGFMIGGTFLNRGHFDLVYHFLALFSCVYLVARKEIMAGPKLETEGVDNEVHAHWNPAQKVPHGMPHWERLG